MSLPLRPDHRILAVVLLEVSLHPRRPILVVVIPAAPAIVRRLLRRHSQQPALEAVQRLMVAKLQLIVRQHCRLLAVLVIQPLIATL